MSFRSVRQRVFGLALPWVAAGLGWICAGTANAQAPAEAIDAADVGAAGAVEEAPDAPATTTASAAPDDALRDYQRSRRWVRTGGGFMVAGGALALGLGLAHCAEGGSSIGGPSCGDQIGIAMVGAGIFEVGTLALIGGSARGARHLLDLGVEVPRVPAWIAIAAYVASLALPFVAIPLGEKNHDSAYLGLMATAGGLHLGAIGAAIVQQRLNARRLRGDMRRREAHPSAEPQVRFGASVGSGQARLQLAVRF